MPRIFLNPFSGNIDMAPDNVTKNLVFNSWFTDEENPAPFLEKEWKVAVAKFNQGGNQVMKGQIKVMSDYYAGQLLMRLTFYIPSIVGNVKLSMKTILRKVGVDSSSEASLHTWENTFNIASAIPNKLYKIEIPLTDANGKLNGVTIAADDMLDFALKREDVAQDASDDLRVYPACEIIKT